MDRSRSLSSKERARVMDFIGKLSGNPKNPGISLERVGRAGAGLWSGRVSQELRAILAQEGEDWFVLHVDHHDEAYRWAERRRAGRNPRTGVFQVVDLEAVSETPTASTQGGGDERVPTFSERSDDYLLSLGVPPELLPALREVRSEADVFALLEVVGDAVAERLLALAVGDFVVPPAEQDPERAVLEDRRRYFVVEGEDQVAAALEGDLADWMLFLHPDQRPLVEGVFSGPVLVTGAAGTGKTVVGLHRARELARRGARVLVATYTTTLAVDLATAMKKLCHSEPEVGDRITVSTVHAEAKRLSGGLQPEGSAEVDQEFRDWVETECENPELRTWVAQEWIGVIRPRGIGTWAAYRSADRRGRSRPLTLRERWAAWGLFERFMVKLRDSGRTTFPLCCEEAILQLGDSPSPWGAVVVDEAQDLGKAELRFVSRLGRERPGHLMLVGDSAQRLYGSGTTPESVGLTLSGRRFELRTNYRTTEQILSTAWIVQRGSTKAGERARWSRSLLRGPRPSGVACETGAAQESRIIAMVRSWQADSTAEIAVLARTRAQVAGLRAAFGASGLGHQSLRSGKGGVVRVGTLHSAKGLEFAVVVVAFCDAASLPHPAALAGSSDEQDREDALAHERNLLYVGLTRARDEAVVTWVGKPSTLLEGTGLTVEP